MPRWPIHIGDNEGSHRLGKPETDRCVRSKPRPPCGRESWCHAQPRLGRLLPHLRRGFSCPRRRGAKTVSRRGAYILRHIAFSARTYCSPRTRKISGMASRYCIAHRFVCRCGSDMVAWPEADRVFGSYSRHGRRGDPVALMVCGRCFSLAVAKISVGQLTVAETRAALRGAVP